MMIGLSAIDPCTGVDLAAYPRCGDPTCDATREQCCPGQAQAPTATCRPDSTGKLVPVDSAGSTQTSQATVGVKQVVGTMPTLPPGSCNANQTYIPPGGNMGPTYGNGITPTGACIDNPAPAGGAVVPTVPTFTDGLSAWATPSTAITLFSSISTMFSVSPAAALGYLSVPLAAVGAVIYFMSQQSKKGR